MVTCVEMVWGCTSVSADVIEAVAPIDELLNKASHHDYDCFRFLVQQKFPISFIKSCSP